MSVLVLTNVSKSFGGLFAVKNLSLSLEPGERRGLLGPNGAGKTTLFHLITGLLSVSSGTIEAFGQDISAMKPYDRAGIGISRTFQITNLFKGLTVEQNITLSILAGHRAKFTMMSDLTDHADILRRTNYELERWGFADRRAALVSDLSYGEQRTLEIVVAVTQRPKLLLLDEPTSGLSPTETREAADVIRSLPKEMTSLIIEHDMDVAFDLCHTLTVMNFGQHVETGPVAEIRESTKVQDIYLGNEVEA